MAMPRNITVEKINRCHDFLGAVEELVESDPTVFAFYTQMALLSPFDVDGSSGSKLLLRCLLSRTVDAPTDLNLQWI